MEEEIDWKLARKERVTWNTSRKTSKTGRVVAFCPAGISLERMGYTEFQGTNQDVSKHHRYVVEVKTKTGVKHYYTPIKKFLEKACCKPDEPKTKDR